MHELGFCLILTGFCVQWREDQFNGAQLGGHMGLPELDRARVHAVRRRGLPALLLGSAVLEIPAGDDSIDTVRRGQLSGNPPSMPTGIHPLLQKPAPVTFLLVLISGTRRAQLT